MGVGVHEADLAPEETAALRPLEEPLQTAAVLQGPVEQAGAVGAEQVLFDETQMVAGLLRAEQSAQDGVDHRQQTVGKAGRAVFRMQKILDGARFAEMGEARERPFHHQHPLKIRPDFLRPLLEAQRLWVPAEPPQCLRQGGEHLVVERDRPGAAQMVAKGGVDGLQRIVPVAVAVGGKPRPGDHPRTDHLQRPLDVLPYRRLFRLSLALRMEEGQGLLQERRVLRGEEVLGQGEQRPEHDVAMGIAGTGWRARARKT